MAHLGPAELIDLAEGTRPEAAAPHLQACERCRRQVTELREALRADGSGEVPEPSPLFWDHLSARVSEAIVAEALPREASWFLRWARPHAAMAAAAAACAILAVAAAVSMRVGAGPGPSVARASVGAAIAGTPEAELAPLPDDASIDMVADLAAQAGWDLEGEIGLETHGTPADTAVSQLTAAERSELQRLLSEELRHPGA